MRKLQKYTYPAGKITAAILLGLLVGCGSGGGTDKVLGVAAVGDTTADDATTDDGSVRIGSGSGDTFEVGVLASGIDANSSLSAGGSTTFSVSIVNSSDALVTDETSFVFTSGCVTAETASFDASTVVTTSGIATVTYTAEGCVGDDTITATASGISAEATISVEAEDVLSLEFVSASPSAISITGSGGVETSTVTFRVLGESGNAVTSQSVSFTLDTNTGGVNIPTERSSDTSDINGEVTTIVQAGTLPTPVRVTATDDATGISTQSSGLSIGTAITDADSFDVVVNIVNPSAWDFTGNTITVSAFLGDANNNTPTDDTAVSFITNGGGVQSACLTSDGVCTVTWTGKNPRPTFSDSNGTDQSGDTIILAFTTGSESFDDDDGNGVFDDNDNGAFVDLGEPYFDENQNGSYDEGERFVDTNVNGDYDLPDGKYSGPTCEHSTLCSSLTTITIWQSVPIVMSGNNIEMYWASGATMPAAGGTLTVQEDITKTFTGLSIGDVNGNSPPNGTTISIESGNGTLDSTSSFTVENYYDSIPVSISISGDSESSTGLLKITVDPPNGAKQEFIWNVAD